MLPSEAKEDVGMVAVEVVKEEAVGGEVEEVEGGWGALGLLLRAVVVAVAVAVAVAVVMGRWLE